MFSLEDKLMEAGYKSCMGCVHYTDHEVCAECNMIESRWEPNDRWKAAQAQNPQPEETPAPEIVTPERAGERPDAATYPCRECTRACDMSNCPELDAWYATVKHWFGEEWPELRRKAGIDE